MQNKSLFLGIDLGTSGVRIAVINNNLNLIHFSSIKYFKGLESAQDWERCCKALIEKIPEEIKKEIVTCAVDGTSGTLIGCDHNGKPLGQALAYFNTCLENKFDVLKILENKKDQFFSKSSVSRAFKIINQYGTKILLRHQADWINGWLLENWELGEEGNNIKLGWDLIEQKWPKEFKNLPWFNALPKIVQSGKILGNISAKRSEELGLPSDLKVIAGTTDSNAAVLAAESSSSEGISVLGSTIVIKLFVKKPIHYPGITNHRIGGKWLAGGSSNAGGSILKELFNVQELKDLSRQIDPESNSGLNLLPLSRKGERFPINDPDLEPVLLPRPVSDSLYLHGLLEGLARIEAQAWKKLIELNSEGETPKKIITIGGGSSNPQWRRIRQRLIGLPIHSSSKEPAEGVARLGWQAINSNNSKDLSAP